LTACSDVQKNTESVQRHRSGPANVHSRNNTIRWLAVFALTTKEGYCICQYYYS